MAYENAAEGEEQKPEFPRDARPWLDMLGEAKSCMEKYQDKCDNIDKLYADLETLSATNADREFQIFWANLEVLKPSIYARPPVPVVVPRFKKRKELPRKASEVLERSLITSFELDDIDATMRLVRDDLATNARGVVWCRYEAEQEEDGSVTEKVCKDHLDRKDFRHDPARKWKEVDWVAKRSWVSRKKGIKRFGDIFLQAEFKKDDRDEDKGYQVEKKAEVWEIWCKSQNIVVWVSPGMEEILDAQAPWLELEGFFPCPRPAYGTLKRGSLVPVPDFLYYKDQVEEINELTARISSLSESLRLKGFYPAGVSEVGEAVEAILADTDNRATLVPISNFAAIGPGSLKDSIVWLPVREVAEVIAQLVELRRQLIDDVYQITGISDIMRGSTEANETLGAQQLKSQYGSIRVRDRQQELIRLARDITRIEAEIMAENFSPDTLLAMSQVDDLPTQQDIYQQIMTVNQKLAQAASDPRAQAMAQQNPEAAQQLLQQANAEKQRLQGTVTVEAVVQLLREQRLRPFVLEIETDSTIQPDEDAAKQRATEFVTAVGSYIGTALPMVQQVPQAAPLVAETLKFVASQFRAGRELDGVIDEFADQMKQVAAQPKGPSPEEQKAQIEAQKMQMEAEAKDRENQAKLAQITAKAEADKQANEIKMAEMALELQTARQEHQFKMAEMAAKLQEIDARARATIVSANAKVQAAQAKPETESA